MNDLRIEQIAFAGDIMSVRFLGGQNVAVPLSYFPHLQTAAPSEREHWELVGRGLGVHWESLDEDLSVENILLAYSRTKTSEYAQVALTE